MHTHFKAVAVSAMALVMILTSTSFVVFMMMVHPDLATKSFANPFPPLAHALSAAGKTLLVAYIAGAWAWIMMFALRRSGVHRLERASCYSEKS